MNLKKRINKYIIFLFTILLGIISVFMTYLYKSANYEPDLLGFFKLAEEIGRALIIISMTFFILSYLFYYLYLREIIKSNYRTNIIKGLKYSTIFYLVVSIVFIVVYVFNI
jgi:hypothetical protein